MRAVVRDEVGIRLGEVNVPEAAAGWVRIKVLLAGICRTDLYAASGQLPVAPPRILGHEMVGELADGSRVTVSPVIACERCAACAGGGRCPKPLFLGIGIDGAFAEQVVVPVSCVYPVPADLPLRRGAYVEPIAASLAVLRAPITAHQRGAVIGTGRIAKLTLRILEARGFDRLADGGDEGTFDFVVETSATDEVLDLAGRLVRPGGVIVLKSRPAVPPEVDVARLVRNDVTLCAVSYGPWDEAIELARTLPIDDLLGDGFPLASFAAAFARAGEADGPKVFLDPREGT